MTERTYTVLCPFGGMGGGALGFLQAEVQMLGVTAKFRCLGSIDFNKDACADFTMLTGSKALHRDVSQMTPEELRREFGTVAPDVVFLSPPCKGASGLLSKKKSGTLKYRRMNRLAFDWMKLMVATWPTPPRLVLLENVPRLKQRAKHMLRGIRSVLHRAGYVFTDGFHECGEVGGLAQVRRRYLLVARHKTRVPPILYQPPKKRVRACGEVLGPLPLPGDPSAGPMHELPKLSWLNWVRLSLIPAGGDWRDLEGVLQGGQPRREVFKRHHVEKWTEPSVTVAGSGSNGPSAVADPRLEMASCGENAHHNLYRVTGWENPTNTVTGSTRPGSGAASVADPRVTRFGNVDRVTPWDGPIGTVTHSPAPSSGAAAVADPRVEQLRVKTGFDHAYGVLSFKEPSPTVAGGSAVGQGAYSVADPRLGVTAADVKLNCPVRRGCFGIMGWEQAAATIRGQHDVRTAPAAVADPRKPPSFTPVIIAADGTWHRPLTTLELAVLQSFPHVVNGQPLKLAGTSVSAWRERIGNAVPPKAAREIAVQMLVTLLHADAGTFALSSNRIWVERDGAVMQ